MRKAFTVAIHYKSNSITETMFPLVIVVANGIAVVEAPTAELVQVAPLETPKEASLLAAIEACSATLWVKGP